jgi:hypothetical protein
VLKVVHGERFRGFEPVWAKQLSPNGKRHEQGELQGVNEVVEELYDQLVQTKLPGQQAAKQAGSPQGWQDADRYAYRYRQGKAVWREPLAEQSPLVAERSLQVEPGEAVAGKELRSVHD